MKASVRLIALVLIVALVPQPGAAAQPRVVFGVARLSNGISLHYAQAGRGEAVVFVPGTLADYSYWKDQVGAFSAKYRAITYSRRYDYPNANPAQRGYSAIADADDLAALLRRLGIRRANIVGHSYGALTALFLAIRHPDAVRSVVLAEPPAITLLAHVPGPLHALAAAQYGDIQRRLVAPMKKAFQEGDTSGGVGAFMNYVFGSAHAWQEMSREDKAAELRSAEELRVIMTGGTLFPYVDPQSVRHLRMPVMLVGGTASYPFLITVTLRLSALLPNSPVLWVAGAGHQMWYQDPDVCRSAVERFIDHSRPR